MLMGASERSMLPFKSGSTVDKLVVDRYLFPINGFYVLVSIPVFSNGNDTNLTDELRDELNNKEKKVIKILT